MIFLPALAMRLWADEHAAGTDELLLSLPVGLPGLVLGKLLAAWSVAGIGLILTVPVWISINYLGATLRGAISAMAGASDTMAIAERAANGRTIAGAESRPPLICRTQSTTFSA